MFSSASQTSEVEGETSQEWQQTPQVSHKLHYLNNFLRQASEGRVSPVRSQCTSDVLTLSSTSQRYYKRKAAEAVDSLLDAIAPGNSSWLLEQVIDKHRDQRGIEEAAEGTLVHRLIVLYEEANSWYTRQQILSLIASDFSKSELLQFIPGLTKWRIDEARKHALKNKPGQTIDPPVIARTRLNPVKVDHFIDFLSSPSFLQDVAYGTKTVKLSSGEKLEIPNVVRTLIASRLVQLYQTYCQESGFVAMPRSTLFNIIKVCDLCSRLKCNLPPLGIMHWYRLPFFRKA